MKNLIAAKTAILTLIILLAAVTISSPADALEVRKSVLENGLTLMVVERPGLPVVKVSLGITAGNLHEPAEKSGLANLTASLLTEGTKTRTARRISEEIEFVGGSVGASGGSDYITASLSILKKDVDLGFDILSDIILNPVFPEDELNKKRERLKGSLRSQEEDPGFIASREFGKALFGSHPYGRITAGSAETLDKILREDVIAFHAAHYVPENSIMAVVGDITSGEVERLMKQFFSKWQPRHTPAAPLPELTFDTTKKTIIIDRDLTQANILMGHAGVSRDHTDYYAISVMNYILGGGGFASRLMQNIRDEKGLVYDIQSYFAAHMYRGSFQVGLQTRNESANTAIREILGEMHRISNTLVSDEELSDAKSFLTGSFPMRIETSSRIAGFLVAVEFYGLGVSYINDYPEFINSVTREDVLRAAKKYLDPENFILVVVADKKKAAINMEQEAVLSGQ